MQKLKYLSSFKDRHGKTRWKFRRKGYTSRSICGEFGSEKFMIAYTAALTSKVVVGQGLVKARSMDDLVITYLTSADFRDLAESTQTAYRRILNKFRKSYGSLPVRELKRKHIKQIMIKMDESPTSANRLLSLLSIMLDVALDLEWIDQNHARTVKKIKVKTVGFTPWSDTELEQFKRFYPSGSRERLALALYLYTGQRGCDVAAMRRSDIDGDKIRVVQQKTGQKLLIPLHPELQLELSFHRENMVLMLTEYGKPFSVKGFQQWFAKKARRAGLVSRTGHGMRKATSRKLAEAGCTPHEIQSITGHKTLSEIENYTKAVDQTKLADSAMASLK